VVFVRTVMLAVLASALAWTLAWTLAWALPIAPGAPCAMGPHAATADHRGSEAAAPRSHADHGRASLGPNTPDSAPHAALEAPSEAGPSATAGDDDDDCPGRPHRSKRPACPSPCCPLACQAALPMTAWTGTPLEGALADPVLIGRADGAVTAHPFRIERPPRLAA